MRPPARAVSSSSSKYARQTSGAARMLNMPQVTGTPVSTARSRSRPRYSFTRSGSRPVSSPAISKIPPPRSPSTPTSSRTSSQDATRLATGFRSAVSWFRVREVVKPMAPAARASASSRFIAARSASVAGSEKARSPIA